MLKTSVCCRNRSIICSWENQILKNILDRSGISYAHEIDRIRESERGEEYDPDQGGRISHPGKITVEMANLFYARFWGRQDVYARRSEKKGTGEAVIIRNAIIAGKISVLKWVIRK